MGRWGRSRILKDRERKVFQTQERASLVLIHDGNGQETHEVDFRVFEFQEQAMRVKIRKSEKLVHI